MSHMRYRILKSGLIAVFFRHGKNGLSAHHVRYQMAAQNRDEHDENQHPL